MNYYKEDKPMWLWVFALAVIMYFVLTSMGCNAFQKKEVEKIAPHEELTVEQPDKVITPPKIIQPSLSWELNHSERVAWSGVLLNALDASFPRLDKATDMGKICPKYATLTRDQKINTWAELFVWMAYFESAWNPMDKSVDVGDESDRNTWSVGLLQVSQSDIVNYKIPDMKYSYIELLTPEPNIKLAVSIMANQIDKVGTVLIGPGRKWLYWACIHPFGKYDSSKEIIAKVQKLKFCK